MMPDDELTKPPQALRDGIHFCFTSGTRPAFYPLSGWFLHRWS
jgi:hypothetical protein